MHSAFDTKAKNITYRTPNIYAEDGRFIFFFSDAPHLVKTTRNCLSNSRSHKNSRYMWDNNHHFLWSHISQMYYLDLEGGLDYMPKLKLDHIKLTPYSVMNVRLATQILSETVGKTLHDFGAKDCVQTANVCLYIDKFFDCCNVSHTKDRKVNRQVFKHKDDDRLRWLKEEFLKYFFDWELSIDNRGDYTSMERNKMFISWQSFEGLQITVYSIIECIQFLLDSGFKYVLTSNFNQDDLENYFSKQGGIGHRRDNPTVFAVGYNANIIKSQFSIQPSSGNICHQRKRWEIDDTPIPKKTT